MSVTDVFSVVSSGCLGAVLSADVTGLVSVNVDVSSQTDFQTATVLIADFFVNSEYSERLVSVLVVSVPRWIQSDLDTWGG